jgi:hypothetical protein
MEKFLPQEVESTMPHIRIHKVYGRVKSTESIKASIEKRRVDQNGQKVASKKLVGIVEAVHDLAAFRIITETREEASAVHRWVSKGDHLQKVKDHKIWDLSRPVGPERQSESNWLPEYGAYECWNHPVALQPPPLPHQNPVNPLPPMTCLHTMVCNLRYRSHPRLMISTTSWHMIYFTRDTKGRSGGIGRSLWICFAGASKILASYSRIPESHFGVRSAGMCSRTWLGEEWKSKMRRGLKQALPARAQSTDVLSRTQSLA